MPHLAALRAPDRESNQLPYARRASWHACTKATDATSPSHCRCGVVLARVTTLACTCVSLILSPAPYASCRARSASLNTTRAQPNVLASNTPPARGQVSTVAVTSEHPLNVTSPTDTTISVRVDVPPQGLSRT
jgi:hypothetical protein